MTAHSRLVVLLAAFLLCLGVASAAKPTSFCKCTCFTNSTIIALTNANGAHTCSDCNKSFCLGYNLPICKNAEEKDVFTTCFQRDSAKDEAVVFIFIFTTVGLLGYAAIRPWIDTWAEKARERRAYIPVSGEQQ